MSDTNFNSQTGNFSGLQVGSDTRDPSVLVEMQSTTQGVRLPKMDTIDRDAIVLPAPGLVITNTDNTSLNIFKDGTWREIPSVVNTVETLLIPVDHNLTYFRYKVMSIGQNAQDNVSGATLIEMENLVDVRMIGTADVGASGLGKSIGVQSSYARAGTSIVSFQESDTLSVDIPLANVWFDYSVASVFTNITDGEFKMGLEIKHNNIGGNIRYLFLKILFTRG